MPDKKIAIVTTKQTEGKKLKTNCNTIDNGGNDGVTSQIDEQNHITKALHPKIHLTLNNFDKDEEIPPDCPFVLTSPRSLEACKRLGVRVSHTPFIDQNYISL